MQYLDGKRLKRALDAGYLWLNQNRERLNAINVFPVADGDTGTNMALTLKAAVSGAHAARSECLSDVAGSIAVHSLKGARGNSGVILSQYFKGVAEFIGKRKKLRPVDVAGVFSAGAESAYKAMSDPKEGTILTVLREIGEHLHHTKTKVKTIPMLLESAMEKGKISLSETRQKLKVLSDAGVVDAGAQGFVHFIEGINNLIKTGNLSQISPRDAAVEDLPDVVEEHSNFRYCTEYLVKGRGFDISGLKRALEGYGDSLIVATSGFNGEGFLRLHIHTDSPELVKQVAGSAGTIENEKIDDMMAQNRAMRRWRSSLKLTRRKNIRILTDSTSDLPREVQEFYDIEVVPLQVMFGTSVYRDGIDLNRSDFYDLLAGSSEFPTTSQPSPEDFTEYYKHIFKRGDTDSVISIHVSSKLSGTYNSALKGAQGIDGKIYHFDSGTVSLGLGLMAVAAAEMARNGEKASKIIKKLDEYKKNQMLFFTLKTVDYLIKGGRVGKARGFLGKVLGLKPILTLENGEVKPLAKARNQEKIIERIISYLPHDLSSGKLALAHAGDPEKIDSIKMALTGRIDLNKILTGEIGPTVGAHSGPGSWGLFYMKG